MLQDIDTDGTLTPCWQIDQPHNAAVGLAKRYSQLTEILVQSHEHEIISISISEYLFISRNLVSIHPPIPLRGLQSVRKLGRRPKRTYPTGPSCRQFHLQRLDHFIRHQATSVGQAG